MTQTSVVILNYNGEKLLQQFLPSVIQHSTEAEIIVVDNGSTDQSIFLLKKLFPAIRLILLDKNYGFCGGYNRALKQINSTYVVLLNSDVEVTENWLKPMVSLLVNNSIIAAVQPKILSYSNRHTFEYAGAAGGYIDTLGYPFCRGRIFNTVETDHNQYNDERQIFWGSGACLLIRLDTYNKFEGLDEDFFAHMEEIDLCWKINRTQQKVYYCGKSTVYHLGAGTLGYDSANKTYLNFRNGLTLIFKHLNKSEIIYKLPLRIALDWIASLIFLLKGQPKNTLAVIKAHIHFIKALIVNTRKRKALHEAYPTYSKAAVYPGSVVVDYYLKNKANSPI